MNWMCVLHQMPLAYRTLEKLKDYLIAVTDSGTHNKILVRRYDACDTRCAFFVEMSDALVFSKYVDISVARSAFFLLSWSLSDSRYTFI